MRAPRRLALVALVALSTACGSTVATTASHQVPGDDITAPVNDGLAAPGGGGTTTRVGTGARTGATLTPSASSESDRPAGQAPQPPVASVRGPLRIGVTYPDNGAANGALGVTTSAAGPREVMTALVNGLNRTGGVAGRTLLVDFYAVDSTSSDYASRANEACAHFTQDQRVPVVVDMAFGNKFGMATCLARKGVVDIGLSASDTVDDNEVGLFATPSGMTSTRRYPAVLSGLSATGYLTSANKVGVLLEDCPHLQRVYQRAVVPTLSRLHLTLADTEHVACTTGFSSAAPASASIQSAVLRFNTRGVDRLLMVSDFEQVMLLLLANYAESQGWRPGYLLSSTAQTEVMRPNIPRGQWPQLHGMGWTPGLDIDDPHQPLPTADRRCLSLIKSAGVSVSGWQSTYLATTECAMVFLLEAALRHNGGDASGRAVARAIADLAGSFTAPAVVAGRTRFGPSRHDGPAAVAPFAYVASCDCLRYVGAAVTVP
jgi:hypothetical protein